MNEKNYRLVVIIHACPYCHERQKEPHEIPMDDSAGATLFRCESCGELIGVVMQLSRL